MAARTFPSVQLRMLAGNVGISTTSGTKIADLRAAWDARPQSPFCDQHDMRFLEQLKREEAR